MIDKNNVETTFSYDKYGRLIKVSKDNSENLYKYNDQGYRTRKIVTKGGVTTTIDYILDGSQVVQEKINNEIINYFYDADGKLIGF